MAAPIKESISLRLAYGFRDLVPCLHGNERGDRQAVMMLGKWRELHPDFQAAGRIELLGPTWDSEHPLPLNADTDTFRPTTP